MKKSLTLLFIALTEKKTWILRRDYQNDPLS